MKKWIILTLLSSFSATTAYGRSEKKDWILEKGRLSYHVHYPLKDVEGIATNVKGKGHCENDKCQFLIAVPLKDFKSGDGNRDNHMLEVTKAALNPMVTVKAEFDPSTKGPIDLRCEVNFAGKTHVYDHVPVTQIDDANGTNVKGKLPILLSEFEVERPALLMVKIDDEAPVDFDLAWK